MKYKINIKYLIYILFYFCIITCGIFVNKTDPQIIVYYSEMPENQNRLFFDTGNGFNESEKVIGFANSKNKTVTFNFSVDINRLESIRIDLDYDNSTVNLNKIEWRNHGVLVSKVDPSELNCYIDSNYSFQFIKENNYVIIKSSNNNVNIPLNKNFINLGNRNLIQTIMGYLHIVYIPIIVLSAILFLIEILKKYIDDAHVRVNIYASLSSLIILFFICNYNITSSVIDYFFPQIEMDYSTMYDTGKVKYQSFELTEHKLLISKDSNAMILIYLPCINRQRFLTLDIDIGYFEENNYNAKFYYVPNYDYESNKMIIGNNKIILKQIRHDTGLIRVDLASKANKKIFIQKIILNNNKDITMGFIHGLKVLFSLCICFMIMYNIAHIWAKSNNELYLKFTNKFKKNYINYYFDLINIILFALLTLYIQYKLTEYELVTLIKYKWINTVLFVNIFFIYLLICVIKNIFGNILGEIVYLSIFTFYTIAQYIKLNFHNELFQKSDFAYISDAIKISSKYINVPFVVLGLILFIFSVYLLKKYLKIKITLFNKKAFLVIMMMILCYMIYLNNGLKTIGMDIEKNYINQKEEINSLGVYGYALADFLLDSHPGEPYGYGADIIEELNELNIEHSCNEYNVKPTVIVILAESLYEIQNDNNLIINDKIMKCMSKYKIANAISCSYGGKTSSAEYEVLTGLSNYYLSYPAYQTDISKDNHYTGSIAREFSENGYESIAVHANTSDFYNREIVYKNMGFTDFISEEDMQLSKDSFCEDGYAKDYVLIDEIIKAVEKNDNPKFIFGVSIESHGPYMNKFDKTNVKCDSLIYSEDDLKEVNNYVQAITDLDLGLERLIKYFEDKEEPLLLYVFGDHMPVLGINEKSGYLSDIYKKYCTPVYAYSNYCDVNSIENNYISLNQITIEVLEKSGIKYRPYYDILNNIREKAPIMHKEIENIDKADVYLNMYEKINWDMIYGKRYLLSEFPQ